MTYENILVETRGRVGVIRLNRPQGAQCAQRRADRRTVRGASTPSRRTRESAASSSPDRRRPSPPAPTSSRWRTNPISTPSWAISSATLEPRRAGAQADDRRGRGLRAGRRLRTRHECDFIIAADNAKFGQPEITLGVMPGMGGTQRLTRAVGKAKAMDLCLTGRMMDAQEAERRGPRRARRAGRKPDGRSDQGRGDDRVDVAPSVLHRQRRRSTAPSRRRWPRVNASSGGSFIRCSPRKIRRKAWPRSWKSARRSSRTNNYFRTQITRVTDALAASIEVPPLAGSTLAPSRNFRIAAAETSEAVVAAFNPARPTN